MNLPEVTMEFEGAYEEEYCSSPIATSPSHRYGFGIIKGDIDFDQACFLIEEGAVTKHDYILKLTESEWAKQYAPDVETNELLYDAIEELVDNTKVIMTWSDLV